MDDPRQPILDSVAARQSYAPTEGDLLMVGIRPAFVTSARPLRLLYDDGTVEEPTDITERALSIIEVNGEAPAFLDVAWPYAFTTTVDESMKVAVLMKMAARAPTPEDAATVRGWAVALASGKVPVR